MKTPSFIELQSLVEFFNEELFGSQLQEVHASSEGLVLVFYRFIKHPKTAYLVFDLDIQFPFLGLYFNHPWPHIKKTIPVGLFLNSHAKNLVLKDIKIKSEMGRVLQISLGDSGPGYQPTHIEFRLIPKYTNLIVTKDKKSISWYPVKPLTEVVPQTLEENPDVRSIPFILNGWLERRAQGNKVSTSVANSQSPYEKWKMQRQKDLRKKQNALIAIESQIQDFLLFPWIEIGQHLKTYGTNDLKNEWHQHLNFEISVSKNIQNCFAKAKAAKVKIIGAQKRLAQVQSEIDGLSDLSEDVFSKHLVQLNQRQKQNNKSSPRKVEGRFRKLVLENNTTNGLICYMGKSAKDNLDLLRKAKAWDIWVHLKDYPSAHAIVHLNKDQVLQLADLKKVAHWLIKETFKDKMPGTKYAVIYVECRHVRPIKGDKLGRVTHHDAREILIAL